MYILCCFDTFVSQPERDHGAVDAVVQEFQLPRCGVARVD